MTKVIVDNAMLSAFLEMKCTTLLDGLAKKFGWSFDIPSIVKNESMQRSGISRRSITYRIKKLGNVIAIDKQRIQSLKARFFKLHEGELEAISIALDYKESNRDYMIIFDDDEARRTAKELGLRMHGTIWILSRAYKAMIINYVELVYYLEGLRRVGFWYEDKTVEAVLSDPGF